MSLTACNTPKVQYVILDHPPTIYASELELVTPPELPLGEQRTNCAMHNYRVLWQQFGCDTAAQFKNFVERIGKGETILELPKACKAILEQAPVYCASD
jgi:hypothetical protein